MNFHEIILTSVQFVGLRLANKLLVLTRDVDNTVFLGQRNGADRDWQIVVLHADAELEITGIRLRTVFVIQACSVHFLILTAIDLDAIDFDLILCSELCLNRGVLLMKDFWILQIFDCLCAIVLEDRLASLFLGVETLELTGECEVFVA